MNELTPEQFSQLSKRISKSEKEAFDTLFRILYGALVRFAFRYVKQKANATDIVQEAFIKLWHNREALDDELSIKAYLYKIVRNLSLNHIRDHSFEQTGLEIPDLPAEDKSDVANRRIKDLNRMNLLKQWITELPERQREAIKLSRFEGLDHDEIAEVMNVSKRTVNNHIVQAMKNIQRMYEQNHSEKRNLGYD